MKQFKSRSPLKIADGTEGFSQECVGDDDAALECNDLDIHIPKISGTMTRTIPLEKHRGDGYDDILFAMHRILAARVKQAISSGQQTHSLATVVSSYKSGLEPFFKYLSILSSASHRQLLFDDIDPELVKGYIRFLADSGGKSTTQRTKYSYTKSVLVACFDAGHIPSVDQHTDLFPVNPYPNTLRKMKGEKPLSKTEFHRFITAIKSELKGLSLTSSPLSAYELSICVFGIAARTGLNTTPLLELGTDCIQPHPIKENRRLLVTFKRRGRNTHVTSIRSEEEIGDIQSVMPDVSGIIELVVTRNDSIRKGSDEKNRLFIFESQSKNRQGQVIALTLSLLRDAYKTLQKKFSLMSDDGQPLKVNLSVLRKTYVNRIWELSGHDPLIAARHGKHAYSVADRHYWQAPADSESNFSYLGEIRVKQLLEYPKTPVAQCKDKLRGERSPKNGQPCTEVLACFRCRSCVVTEDDLYRLFSFYWAVVRDRYSQGALKWKKYFRHIIRIIDDDISHQFDPHVVSDMRQKAKDYPHPYWRDLTMLRMAK